MRGRLIRQCENKEDCESISNVDPCDPVFGVYQSRDDCLADGISIGEEGKIDRIPMNVLMKLAGVSSLDAWNRINTDGTIDETGLPSKSEIDSNSLRTIRQTGLLLVLEIEYRK